MINEEDNTLDEKLVIMDEDGLHVLSEKVAEKLAKKNISASMITSLNSCAARWLADSFVIPEIVEQEPDNPARRGSLFHKVMEDFFALPKEERTTTAVKELTKQTLVSEDFVDLSTNVDVVQWLRGAINNYYSMGGRPQKVNVAEIIIDEKKGVEKGLEVFVKGQIGNSKRDVLGFIDRLVLDTRDDSLIIEDWKGLALDTPLPTPNGWTTMKEIHIGEELLGTNGKATKVLNKSSIHNRPCYEIIFEDGEKIVCDNVHLWNISTNNNTETLNADELYETFSKNPHQEYFINNPAPVAFSETDVPLPKFYYGDYNASNYETFEQHPHIKTVLRSSIQQRKDFLQKTIEQAYTWNKKKNFIKFFVQDEKMKNILTEVISSLGMTAYVKSHEKHGYQIKFSPLYKIFGQKNREENQSYNKRIIKNVKKVETVPTQCVKVDAEDSLYLCGKTMVPTHNTGAKMKKWKSHTKSDEGLAEQRQQLIYKMLLEQKGFTVSGARLIYPVAKGIVEVDIEDQELLDRVIKDVEETDEKLDAMIETNTFEYTPSFLCAWCPISALCSAADIKPYKKMQDAFHSQPNSEVLLKGIELR